MPLLVFGIPILIMFLVASGLVLVPFFTVRGAIRLFQRLGNRPPSTERLRTQLEELSDVFPQVDAFEHEHLEHLLAAWGDRLPIPPIFDRIIRISGALYSAQGFDPLAPPLPSAFDAISEGRYRDEVISGLRTASDAAQILRLLHSTLRASFSELVRKLPPSSLAHPDALRRNDDSPHHSSLRRLSIWCGPPSRRSRT